MDLSDLDLYLIRGSLEPQESAPANGILIDSAIFVQYIRVTNTQTDTQTTLCVTSVAIGNIYDVHVMRTNNNNNNNNNYKCMAEPSV